MHSSVSVIWINDVNLLNHFIFRFNCTECINLIRKKISDIEKANSVLPFSARSSSVEHDRSVLGLDDIR